MRGRLLWRRPFGSRGTRSTRRARGGTSSRRGRCFACSPASGSACTRGPTRHAWPRWTRAWRRRGCRSNGWRRRALLAAGWTPPHLRWRPAPSCWFAPPSSADMGRRRRRRRVRGPLRLLARWRLWAARPCACARATPASSQGKRRRAVVVRLWARWRLTLATCPHRRPVRSSSSVRPFVRAPTGCACSCRAWRCWASRRRPRPRLWWRPGRASTTTATTWRTTRIFWELDEYQGILGAGGLLGYLGGSMTIPRRGKARPVAWARVPSPQGDGKLTNSATAVGMLEWSKLGECSGLCCSSPT
mmetsp:Transcript_13051/g.41901  ORF Transcript_13051/g.41901 Transcript_13051/m.41901 type:complete len:302 (+) Transcript_13051:524-1429(+)